MCFYYWFHNTYNFLLKDQILRLEKKPLSFLWLFQLVMHFLGGVGREMFALVDGREGIHKFKKNFLGIEYRMYSKVSGLLYWCFIYFQTI